VGSSDGMRFLIRLMIVEMDLRLRSQTQDKTALATNPRMTITTKTVKTRSEVIVAVSNATKKEIAIDAKKIARFKYNELGDPVDKESNS